MAPRENAHTQAELEAYGRLADFVNARIRHLEVTHKAVADRTDGTGRPYVGRRSLNHATAASWPNRPAARTILGLELSLELRPGTLRIVMVDAAHGEDPTQPRHEPPPMARYPALMRDADTRAADRIAERAAEAS